MDQTKTPPSHPGITADWDAIRLSPLFTHSCHTGLLLLCGFSVSLLVTCYMDDMK